MSTPPSYFSAFLGHPRNLVFLAAAACVAIFASIPYGWGALGAVLVSALGIEILAALVVPDLPSFRAAVDAAGRNGSRSERQNRLLDELSRRGQTRTLETFEHMRSRVNALYQTAGDSSTTLTATDVDKLADLTVDYLSLSMVNLSLKERRAEVSADEVDKRIAALQAQLTVPSLAADEAHQLQKALAEYVEAGNRSRRLELRRSTLEATLLSLPDKIEEVFQLVMAAPFSAEMGSRIEESLARLRIAEEVSAEFDSSEPFSLPPATTVSDSTVMPINARHAARRVKY